jgi:pyrroloquinoline quinone (PQQ) biosynthesis protein C
MVSYTYDQIARVSPLTFFGLVHVLEGTSVVVADQVASRIQEKLQLPESAFSYLRSHGEIDLEHIKFFEGLMGRITDKKEQDLIVSSAKKFYRLYAEIFRTLDKNHSISVK